MSESNKESGANAEQTGVVTNRDAQNEGQSDINLVAAVQTRASASREARSEATPPEEGPALVKNPFDPDELRLAQEQDEDVGPVLGWVVASQRPNWTVLQGHSDATRVLCAQWDSLVVKEGILYRRFHSPDGATKFLQIVLPSVLRERAVTLAHGGMVGGHFGM